MRIPNGSDAIVDIAKLRDYALNPDHPRGKHKAKVFEAALGLTRADAKMLAQLFRDAVVDRDDAVRTLTDPYGVRYQLDVTISGLKGLGTVRTVWIVPADEKNPHLVTCWVL